MLHCLVTGTSRMRKCEDRMIIPLPITQSNRHNTLGVAPLKQVGWSIKLCKPYKSHNSEITGLFVGQLFISPKKTRSVYDCNKRSAIRQILSLKTICFTFGCLYTHENTDFALPMANSIHKDSIPFLLHSALTRRLWGISDLTYIM